MMLVNPISIPQFTNLCEDRVQHSICAFDFPIVPWIIGVGFLMCDLKCGHQTSDNITCEMGTLVRSDLYHATKPTKHIFKFKFSSHLGCGYLE
jgi:hypothetical protein